MTEPLSPLELRIANKTVTRFCQSLDKEISIKHIPKICVDILQESLLSREDKAVRRLVVLANQLQAHKSTERNKLLSEIFAQSQEKLNEVDQELLSKINLTTLLGIIEAAIASAKSNDDMYVNELDIDRRPLTPLKALDAKHKLLTLDQELATILEAARELWSKIKNEYSGMPMDHAHYLKLWQLSDPLIDTNILYIDEAQDLDPVLLDVLSRQQCQKIWVGDQYQQIYAWRGAINALEQIQDVSIFYLTETYRFHSTIAQLSNMVLSRLKASKCIRSFVTELASPSCGGKHAIIARRNATLLDEAFKLATQGKYFSWTKFAPDKLFGHCQNIIDLQQSKEPAWDMYREFPSIEALKLYLKDEGNNDLFMTRQALDLCLRTNFNLNKSKALCDQLNQFNNPNADLVLSTAHGAKGLEWEDVSLLEDFDNLIDSSHTGEAVQSDLNLLYVAITRAKHNVLLPSRLKQLLSNNNLC